MMLPMHYVGLKWADFRLFSALSLSSCQVQRLQRTASATPRPSPPRPSPHEIALISFQLSLSEIGDVFERYIILFPTKILTFSKCVYWLWIQYRTDGPCHNCIMGTRLCRQMENDLITLEVSYITVTIDCMIGSPWHPRYTSHNIPYSIKASGMDSLSHPLHKCN